MAQELSARCKRIRERLVNFEPIICPEGAVIWTESFKKTEDQPPVLRAAMALKALLEQKTIFINEDELLVGNQGSALRAAPVHPQITNWYYNELDKFNFRKASKFTITEEAKEQIRSVQDYWKGKTVIERTYALLPQEAVDSMDSKMFTCAYTLNKGTGHFLLNFEKVLKDGFYGIEKECKEKLDHLDYANPEDFEKISLYKALIMTCQSVKHLTQRYADLAKEWQKKEKDEVRKKSFLQSQQTVKRFPIIRLTISTRQFRVHGLYS